MLCSNHQANSDFGRIRPSSAIIARPWNISQCCLCVPLTCTPDAVMHFFGPLGAGEAGKACGGICHRSQAEVDSAGVTADPVDQADVSLQFRSAASRAPGGCDAQGEWRATSGPWGDAAGLRLQRAGRAQSHAECFSILVQRTELVLATITCSTKQP
jgi:hypothetical protein